jgi:hypothetical protein
MMAGKLDKMDQWVRLSLQEALPLAGCAGHLLVVY